MDGACGNIRKHIELQDINSNQTFHVETVVLLSKGDIDKESLERKSVARDRVTVYLRETGYENRDG